eukprot:177625_1
MSDGLYTQLTQVDATERTTLMETHFEAHDDQTLMNNDDEDTQSPNVSEDEEEQEFDLDLVDEKEEDLEEEQKCDNNVDLERLQNALWYVYHGITDPFSRERTPTDTMLNWIEEQMKIIQDRFDGQNDLFTAHLIVSDEVMRIMKWRNIANTFTSRKELSSQLSVFDLFYDPAVRLAPLDSLIVYYQTPPSPFEALQHQIDWNVVAKALSTDERIVISSMEDLQTVREYWGSSDISHDWLDSCSSDEELYVEFEKKWDDSIGFQNNEIQMLFSKMNCLSAYALTKRIQGRFNLEMRRPRNSFIKTEGYDDLRDPMKTPMVHTVDIIALKPNGKYYYEVTLTSQDDNEQDDNELDIGIGWAQMQNIEGTSDFKVCNYWTWNGWRGVVEYGSKQNDVHVDESASVPPYKWKHRDRILCFLDLEKDCMVFSSRQYRYRSPLRMPFYFEIQKFKDSKKASDSELIVPIIFARNHQSYKFSTTFSKVWDSSVVTNGLYPGFVDLRHYYYPIMPSTHVRRMSALEIDFAALFIQDEIKEWHKTGEDASEKIMTVLKWACPVDYGNNFIYAIRWAVNLHEYSRCFPIIAKDIVQIAKFCQRIALDILNTIQSNRLRLLLLEHEDALDIIIKKELKILTSSPTLQILRLCIWTTPPTDIIHKQHIELIRDSSVSELRMWCDALFTDYIYTWKSQLDSEDYYFTCKVQHDYFYSPLGDIQVEFVVYLLYLFFIIYMGMSVPNVYQYPMEKQEILFWVCNGSVIGSELVQYLKNSEEYRADRTNKIDIGICIMYLSIFVLRMMMINDDTNCNDDVADMCLYGVYNVIYLNLWFILLLLSCLRVVYLSSIFESMALLLSNIGRMTKDMTNIFIFIFIFVLGFAAAIYMSTEGELESYDDPIIAIRTTLYGFIDGMEWSEFNDLRGGKFRAYMLQMWVFIFVIFAVLILLNLIIAIMSSTYEDVNAKAKVNNDYYRWTVCYAKCNTFTILPPPFEFPITLICFLVRKIYLFCTCGAQELNLSYLIWKKRSYNVAHGTKMKLSFEVGEEWICRYCAALNVDTDDNDEDENDILRHIEDYVFPFAPSNKDLIRGLNVQTCQHCYRIKKEARLQNVFESVVSFYCFIIMLVPLRIITFAIQFVTCLLGCCVWCCCCCSICGELGRNCRKGIDLALGLVGRKRNCIEMDWKVDANDVKEHFDYLYRTEPIGMNPSHQKELVHARDTNSDFVLNVDSTADLDGPGNIGELIFPGTARIFDFGKRHRRIPMQINIDPYDHDI